MSVRVLLFAAAREAAGTGSIELNLGETATVADVFAELAALHPDLAPVLGSCRAAVDETFAQHTTAAPPGSVVAVLPPVSGG